MFVESFRSASATNVGRYFIIPVIVGIADGATVVVTEDAMLLALRAKAETVATVITCVCKLRTALGAVPVAFLPCFDPSTTGALKGLAVVVVVRCRIVIGGHMTLSVGGCNWNEGHKSCGLYSSYKSSQRRTGL